MGAGRLFDFQGAKQAGERNYSRVLDKSLPDLRKKRKSRFGQRISLILMSRSAMDSQG
jgi:hypothetical protein